jgi:hypothetical protein
VMESLTPDLIGRIASAVELDRNKAQFAIRSAVPALLAAFNDTATQPGGAQKLADAAGQQTSTLRNFVRVHASGAQSSLFEEGSRMLLSLVGARNQNALTEAIATFTGLEQGATGSLLGLLAPIVMGTIAKQQGTRSLDANGIANLFASQKDNIADALPSGLVSMLSGTGLLNSLSGASRTATTASNEAMRAASPVRPVDAARTKNTIIVLAASLAVFASMALLGTLSQKAQNAGISPIDPGFVPSTGQINAGRSKP